MEIKKEMRQKILEENIKEHSIEAEYYDLIHKEIFNTYEQERIKCSLKKLICGFQKNIKVLDVGSGTGNMTEKIISICGDENIDVTIHAVDISEEMQGMMKEKLAGDQVKIKYFRTDIDSFIISTMDE